MRTRVQEADVTKTRRRVEVQIGLIGTLMTVTRRPAKAGTQVQLTMRLGIIRTNAHVVETTTKR